MDGTTEGKLRKLLIDAHARLDALPEKADPAERRRCRASVSRAERALKAAESGPGSRARSESAPA